MSTAITTTDGDENAVLKLWKNVQENVLKAWVATKTGSVNAKEVALIKKLEFDIDNRKKKFGADFLTLKLDQQAGEDALQACINEAIFDIENLKRQITEHEKAIESNNADMRKKVEE
jgi:hypothetical protein